ncbi:MAG: hypothetical protein R3Y28_03700 [Candidatus Gastranaerophilales bacterium]
MKVDINSINNSRVVLNNAQKYPMKNRSNNTNFNGATSVAKNIDPSEINKFMPKPIQAIYKFHKNSGELQDIIVNACGTGLIAPVFIKWNPLSKTDEDTRTYSALRQPISAVLAVGTQGLLTIPFNAMLNNMFNPGDFSDKYNKTAFQDINYIKKQLKIDNPNLSLTDLEKKANEISQKQSDDLINSIKENNITFKHTKGKPDTQMSKEAFDKLSHSSIADMIKAETGHLERFEQIKIPQRIQRSEYYRTNQEEVKGALNEIDNLIKGGTDPDGIRTFIQEKMKSKGNSMHPELKKIMQEIEARTIHGNTDEVYDEIKMKITKMLDPEKGHVAMYKDCESIEDVEKIVRKNLEPRKKDIDETLKFLREMEAKLKDGTGVGEIEKLILEKSKNSPKSSINKYKNFAEQIAEKFKGQINNNISSFKRTSNLVVACAILPVTCYMLNWIYPRFMDAVFPNLSNKKHAKVDHDFVGKANQNMEVK